MGKMAERKDYIADRRQYTSGGKRQPGSGWMIMRWDPGVQMYRESTMCYQTKRAAEETLHEERQRSDAARALRAIPSERRSQQSRANGALGGRPRGRPRKAHPSA